MRNAEGIIGHKCDVTWKSGFVLHGTILDADKEGIILKTTQKTSWIALSNIAEIVVED